MGRRRSGHDPWPSGGRSLRGRAPFQIQVSEEGRNDLRGRRSETARTGQILPAEDYDAEVEPDGTGRYGAPAGPRQGPRWAHRSAQNALAVKYEYRYVKY